MSGKKAVIATGKQKRPGNKFEIPPELKIEKVKP
jgi:hypothetical protein